MTDKEVQRIQIEAKLMVIKEYREREARGEFNHSGMMVDMQAREKLYRRQLQELAERE